MSTYLAGDFNGFGMVLAALVLIAGVGGPWVAEQLKHGRDAQPAQDDTNHTNQQQQPLDPYDPVSDVDEVAEWLGQDDQS